MLNKKIIYNYLLPWTIKKIIPWIILIPSLVFFVAYILFFSTEKHFIPFNSSMIGLTFVFLLYLYNFIFKKAKDRNTRIALAIIFSLLAIIVSFFINSYNESFNRLFIISKERIDYVFILLYIFNIFFSLIFQKKEQQKYLKNNFSMSEREFIKMYKLIIPILIIILFTITLVFIFLFTDTFKMKDINCKTASDCPTIEKNESGNWNCKNLCEEGKCQFECTQKKNIVIKKDNSDCFVSILLYSAYSLAFIPILIMIISLIYKVKKNKSKRY
ncbi:hypothetical protein KAS31_05165 [Candidatus Parcubacteria bacterium]|nr:hypothetical protein [Candidatus Parcubacteria bacterium]